MNIEVRSLVRKRLVHLRESHDVTQEKLSKAMGMGSRQSLAELEAGKRSIQPQELIAAADFFNVRYSYFTDPLELAGEAEFSWRKSSACEKESIDDFEKMAEKWIATYRHLGNKMVAPVISLLPRVELSKNSTFEEAYREGSNVAVALELGDIPANNLTSVLTEKLGILILFLDICPEISGAACKLGSLDTIMINRNETPARRNFDLAHEFFHLITWATMPPERIEDTENSAGWKKSRIEQLADAFAAGLLMPESSLLNYVKSYGMPSKDNIEWIVHAAAYFKVSGSAMKWRLTSLGYFTPAIARKIDDTLLRFEIEEEHPKLFSYSFTQRIGWAIDHGVMSVRKVADALRMTIDDLKDLFTSHGLIAPFDL
ncbi:ImmA/IrrE family metallo-endopeptidase [Methylotenera sp. 1P/1]|uniref:ImmA/IrrE family metallo-endopeptidase n=1 Tax=Methylotenera sp. 1P/1 TaxID=1131551 RepID=UPI000375660B|nr:ImmA/IrrE family metallo-endopeptidase [Methylotenera sp. 1P/1]